MTGQGIGCDEVHTAIEEERKMKVGWSERRRRRKDGGVMGRLVHGAKKNQNKRAGWGGERRAETSGRCRN